MSFGPHAVAVAIAVACVVALCGAADPAARPCPCAATACPMLAAESVAGRKALSDMRRELFTYRAAYLRIVAVGGEALVKAAAAHPTTEPDLALPGGEMPSHADAGAPVPRLYRRVASTVTGAPPKLGFVSTRPSLRERLMAHFTGPPIAMLAVEVSETCEDFNDLMIAAGEILSYIPVTRGLIDSIGASTDALDEFTNLDDACNKCCTPIP
jgi:hypothetical protein